MRKIIMLALACLSVTASFSATTSFADFDRRAREGERLNVVFFGASLTWGANATDQATTTYRAQVGDMFEKAYPKAHFKFYDAAIGGTGSQLGVFRLNRDVLQKKPDLVFLDFSANDDIYSDDLQRMASYESLIRRIILEAKAPVVQMIFPFEWNIKSAKLEDMKRRTAHIALSNEYHTAMGDAIEDLQGIVARKETTIEKIWPYDGVHPGDYGYTLFAQTAWKAYQKAVKDNLTSIAPEKMHFADTYMQWNRAKISSIYAADKLPRGWAVGHPSLTAAWYDGLMSRWLDDETIATGVNNKVNADGTTVPGFIGPERLKVLIQGSVLMLFGEKTMASGNYRVYIDGILMPVPGQRELRTEFSASSQVFGGNVQLIDMITDSLDPTVEHVLEIEPMLTQKNKELRIESICVAGGPATVKPFQY